eukprot:9165089-Pyramimonas_sp.AAC.1
MQAVSFRRVVFDFLKVTLTCLRYPSCCASWSLVHLLLLPSLLPLPPFAPSPSSLRGTIEWRRIAMPIPRFWRHGRGTLQSNSSRGRASV